MENKLQKLKAKIVGTQENFKSLELDIKLINDKKKEIKSYLK